MSAPLPRSAFRFAGLDGLRAIAVVLVLIYHLFPGTLFPFGLIGVDVFFVISGFLITSLLVREKRKTGRIALGTFWLRRARRLLPALAAVVTICASLAWVVGGDVLVKLGQQVLGAATFSFNWISIANGSSYFAASEPDLFRNFWSLAVEEQFYLVWPLAILLFLLIPSRAVRAGLALVLALASAGWAFALAAQGADLTRIYFGTDTHAFGLLLGVALAFALHGAWEGRADAADAASSQGAAARRRRRLGALVRLVVAAAALTGMVVLAAMPEPADDAAFLTMLFAASVLSAVLLLVGVWPGSAVGRVLDNPVMTWIGRRSYGIYLWHWPLLVLATAAITGLSPDVAVPAWIGFAVLAVTIIVSSLSYKYLEEPVRAMGFRGFVRSLGRAVAGRGGARRRVPVLASLAVAVLALAGTGAAVAAAPQVSSGQAVVDAGAAALAEAAEETASASGPVLIDRAPEPGGAVTLPACVPAPGAAQQGGCAIVAHAQARPLEPAPMPIDGSRITAIGDSVMLASAPGLLERFPGIQVDASVSRSMFAGPGIVSALAGSGQLREYVVVALGTNGTIDAESLQRVYELVGPDRHLILVNSYAPREWIPGVNDDLAAFVAAHPDVKLADWSGAIAGRLDLLAGDHVHPGAEGGRLFADTVAAAIEQVELDRAMSAYYVELYAWMLDTATSGA